MVWLVVWRNEPETEEGCRKVTEGPVYDEPKEDITTARMYYYKHYFHGYNGQIQGEDGKILAPLT